MRRRTSYNHLAANPEFRYSLVDQTLRIDYAVIDIELINQYTRHQRNINPDTISKTDIIYDRTITRRRTKQTKTESHISTISTLLFSTFEYGLWNGIICLSTPETASSSSSKKKNNGMKCTLK